MIERERGRERAEREVQMSAEEAVDWCKECGASSIWDHKALQGMCQVEPLRAHPKKILRRSECKHFGGSGICEHNRIRWVHGIAGRKAD